MSKPTVVVTRRWPQAVEEKLNELFDVQLNASDQPFNTEQMRTALQTADALLTTVTDKVSADVFDMPGESVKTQIIGNYGVGYSHIDTAAAAAADIVITNTPDVLSECTADIAMTLILMVARRAGEGERELRAGKWSGWRPTHMVGAKVSNSTLGIVGFGRIGREAARRALGFGMKICVYNRSAVDPRVLSEYGATQIESLAGLVNQSDFISLHCPGGDANRHLISRELITQMKPTAYLINTARGEVVDESALLDALESSAIAGAGLDVFDNEPDINQRFMQLENVALLPHLGSATAHTREAMGFRVVENLQSYFSGEQPGDRVV